ncbi:LuxR C-terminal-related transcriptional regulator [Ktedonosporobacter rubrisoli]|nr:LuxR C-terminal-related transcriptional regulator [Ktedonosporobacter rubrisoli]
MKHTSPTAGAVEDEILRNEQDGQEISIALDSPAWFRWLESATAFSFRSAEGHFTAHKTRAGNQRGEPYWRATLRSRGKLYSFYLGQSPRLTSVRLHEAAHELSQRAANLATPSAEPASGAPSSSEPPIDRPDPLLLSRLSLPRLPLQHVARPRLLTLLEQSVQRPVTLISAPAGSGKTTLLAEWAITTDLTVSWLSLEEEDNDPAIFFPYLMAALRRCTQEEEKLERAVPAHSWKQAITHLLNDLMRRLEHDAVIVLDDIHLLTSPEIHTILHFLIEHLPTRLHLAMGTRVDPSLPLARLRARSQLSELRTEELSFVSGEVEAFVEKMGLRLEGEDLRLLEEHTEGWIAGIQLFTLALRGQRHSAAFLRSSSRSHHFLLDYISEEILAQQEPAMQQFLLHTCILDSFCAALCDSVTGNSDGETRLAEALKANLFVRGLDNTQTWYRYHQLFAEVLRTHLQRHEPEQIPGLYRRASCWYEQQGWHEEACDYALRAGDLPRAAALLEQLVPHLVGQGKFRRLLQWSSQLPQDIIGDYPLLFIASMIGTQVLRGSILGAQNIGQSLPAALTHLGRKIRMHTDEPGSPWAGLQSGLQLLQAIKAWTSGDIAQTIALLSEISTIPLPSASTASRVIALGRQLLLGLAYSASGDLHAAEQIIIENPSHDEDSASSPFTSFALIFLADVYEAQGQLHKLESLYHEILLSFERSGVGSPLLMALAHTRRAGLLYERNCIEEAEAAIKMSQEIERRIELLAPAALSFSAPLQARIALAQGDIQSVRILLENKGVPFWRSLAESQTKKVTGATLARLALLCGQNALAEEWVQASDMHFDDQINLQIANRDYVPYVTLARILLARGRQQHAPLALAQALTLLECLQSAVTAVDARGWLLEVQMLTVLTLQAQGKTKRALQLLGSALSVAEQAGYMRLLVDEGQPMGQLLAQVAVYTSASPAYLQRLQVAIGPSVSKPTDATQEQAQDQPLLDPLSEREHEILGQLAKGLSNQQIAQQLVISLYTVKLHVKHILAKLAVTNRTQAVARARELHLI